MGGGDLSIPRVPMASGEGDARLDQARRAAARGDATETARQFETLFATLLVRELRRAMPKGMFGDGPGADVYEGWFDEQLGSSLAGREALGIAGMVRVALEKRAAHETPAATTITPAAKERSP
jgi:Rod binding domain-containing protein